MQKIMKIASVVLATIMIMATIPVTASAASKKAVSVANTSKGVKISWKKTSKAGKYKVYRSTSKKKGFKVVGTTKKVTFTDKKAKTGKTYYYTVKTAKKTKASYKISKIVRLKAPVLKSVVAAESRNEVKIKWSGVKGAKSYRVYYAPIKNGKAKYDGYETVKKTNTTVVLDKATTYKFQIVAVNGSSKSCYSNAKKLKFVKTPDIVIKAGETTKEVAEAVTLIEELGKAFGVKMNVTLKVENPEIVSIDENNVVKGLAVGDTKIVMTISSEVEGVTNNTTTKIWIRVKGPITEEMAADLVKEAFKGEYAYIPSDKTVTRDGQKYYEVAVKKLTEQGVYTTITIYYVRTDGKEVFDKYAAAESTGEYIYEGPAGTTIFRVNDDNTFEIEEKIGTLHQVTSGAYKFGITNSEHVVKLILNPKKIVTDDNGTVTTKDAPNVQYEAIIKNTKLTVSMESMETVYTKK